MSFALQNMITAAGSVRTVPAVYAGTSPNPEKVRPSQWFSWQLGDTLDAGITFRVATERLCEFLQLFGDSADALGAGNRTHTWHFRSPEHWLATWRSTGGPLHDVYNAVDPDWRDQLSAELRALIDRFNVAIDGSVVIRSEYLEFVVHKSDWRV